MIRYSHADPERLLWFDFALKFIKNKDLIFLMNFQSSTKENVSKSYVLARLLKAYSGKNFKINLPIYCLLKLWKIQIILVIFPWIQRFEFIKVTWHTFLLLNWDSFCGVHGSSRPKKGSLDTIFLEVMKLSKIYLMLTTHSKIHSTQEIGFVVSMV